MRGTWRAALARDHPAALEAGTAETFPSIRAAAIAVGAAKKQLTCVATPEGLARATLKHLAPPDVQKVVGYLQQPGTLPERGSGVAGSRR